MQRHTGPIPPDPTDSLVRNAVRELPGAGAATRAKLQQHFAAEKALARRARVFRLQAAVALGAAAVLMLAVFLNLDWIRSTVGSPAPQTAQENAPAPAPQPQPAPQPAPANNVNQPAPQPQPEPAPQLPPEEVETPKPSPEQPALEQPKPEEPKPEPGPRVDEPKPEPEPPKPPEGTEAKPPEPKAVIARLASEGPKVRLRYGAGEWADAEAGAELRDGVALSVARGQCDLWLAGGALIRFDGEIALSTTDKLTTISIESKSVYADNLGLNAPLAFALGDLRGEMADGACVARRDQAALELACLHGQAALGGETVAPGNERRMTSRGVGAARKFAGSRLTRDLPTRVVYREDFDTPPPGGLYGEGEKLEAGHLVRRGAGNFAAFRYNPTVTVQPGMVLRFRARTKAVSQLQLEVFLDKPHDASCFNQRFKPAKDGEWQVFEIRLADFADKQDPAVKMQPGQLLRSFKLHIEGQPDALVEVDWVEYVRVQEE